MPSISIRQRPALVTAAALVVMLLPLGPAAAELQGANTQYAVADTNADTSIQHSRLAYPPLDGDDGDPEIQATEALIARADLFADSLASGPLGGAAIQGGRPLLLNDAESGVAADVLAELDRVTEDGATVHILGGLGAQDDSVHDALVAAGYTVNRFGGESRIETAAAIAASTDADTVLIARGYAGDDPTQAFADSLTAGALAASRGWDVLLTETDRLSATTAAALVDGDYESAIIVGGVDAVSTDVEVAVEEIVAEVTRAAGRTRFDTQIALNELRADPIGSFAIVVDGQHEDGWANAFAAANWSGLVNAPLLLTNAGQIPAQTQDYITRNHVDPPVFTQLTQSTFAYCGTNVTPELCQEVATVFGGATHAVGTPAPPVEEPPAPTPVPPPAPAPPVSPHFTSATATTSVTQGFPEDAIRLTYDQPILCTSVDPVNVFTSATRTLPTPGSNYAVTVNTEARTVLTATCTELSSTIVDLTFGGGSWLKAGDLVEITAIEGADADTVLNTSTPALAQAVGDHVQAISTDGTRPRAQEAVFYNDSGVFEDFDEAPDRIDLTFDEPVLVPSSTTVTIDGAVFTCGDDVTCTATGPVVSLGYGGKPLVPGSGVYVTMGGFTDLAGNTADYGTCGILITSDSPPGFASTRTHATWAC